MTGVSPVTLDDLTSGYQHRLEYQYRSTSSIMMLGFSETDVRTMFQYYKDAGQLPIDADIEAMIREMKPWYNNYCFAEESLERRPENVQLRHGTLLPAQLTFTLGRIS